MTLGEVREGFQELLGWEGGTLYAIDFMLSCYLTTYLAGDVNRAWGIFVAGPGTGKSELLESLCTYPQTLRKSGFTENAFSSGYYDKDNPDRDPSILGQLKHSTPPKGRKVIVVPDLTDTLSRRPEKVKTLFGAMRAAFEGNYDQDSGTKGHTTYTDCAFGLLAGCTQVYDDFLHQNQSMGERSMLFRLAEDLIDPEVRQELSLSVPDRTRNRTARAALKARIRQSVAKLLGDTIPKAEDPSTVIGKTPIQERKISLLTDLATTCRTVPRASGALVSSPEPATRLQEQIRAFLDCHAILTGGMAWSEAGIGMAQKICRDTVLPENLRMFRTMWRGSPEKAVCGMTRTEIAVGSRTPIEMVRKQISQWTLIGGVKQIDLETYSLTPRVAAAILETGYL